MKVLIIPEDQTLDGFIVKPVVEALMADLEIPCGVDVLPEPRLRGAGDALNPDVVNAIVRDNPMVDLFILAVDRDCNREGNEEKAAARAEEHAPKLVVCLAVQELEVWMLALYKAKLDASWGEVKAECDPKERWAEPLLSALGAGGPGRGRKKAMRALKGKLQTLLALCEEVRDLKAKLGAARAGGL